MTGPQIATSLRTILLHTEDQLSRHREKLQEAEAMSVHIRAILGFVENGGFSPDRASDVRTSVAGIFTRKQMFAHCVRALQEVAPEMSTRDLGEYCMKAKNMDVANAALRKSMMQRLIDVLTIYEQKGEIISVRREIKTKIWALPR